LRPRSRKLAMARKRRIFSLEILDLADRLLADEAVG
jgi:hypothetical protein